MPESAWIIYARSYDPGPYFGAVQLVQVDLTTIRVQRCGIVSMNR